MYVCVRSKKHQKLFLPKKSFPVVFRHGEYGYKVHPSRNSSKFFILPFLSMSVCSLWRRSWISFYFSFFIRFSSRKLRNTERVPQRPEATVEEWPANCILGVGVGFPLQTDDIFGFLMWNWGQKSIFKPYPCSRFQCLMNVTMRFLLKIEKRQ